MKNFLRFALVALAFAVTGLFAQAATDTAPGNSAPGHHKILKVAKKGHKKHKKHKKRGAS